MFETSKISDTVDIKVLVQFAQKGGTVLQGDFMGEFKRVPQERIDALMDEEAGYTVSEVVDEILLGARGLGRDGVEMSAEEGLAWVKKTPECVQAAYTAFFRAMRPERYNEKTSKRARRNG